MTDIDFGEQVEDIQTPMMNGDDNYRSIYHVIIHFGKNQKKKAA